VTKCRWRAGRSRDRHNTRWSRWCRAANSCPMGGTAPHRHAQRVRAACRQGEQLQLALVRTFALRLVRSLLTVPPTARSRDPSGHEAMAICSRLSMQTQRCAKFCWASQDGCGPWGVRGFWLFYIRVRKLSRAFLRFPYAIQLPARAHSTIRFAPTACSLANLRQGLYRACGMLYPAKRSSFSKTAASG
jgi:hypothetical protein